MNTNPYFTSLGASTKSSSSSTTTTTSNNYATTTPAAGPAFPSNYNAAYDPYSSYGAPAGNYNPSYDADLMAQQSIYTPEASRLYQQQQQAEGGGAGSTANGKGKAKARTTVLRKGGGEVWEDQSLLEWDPSHFRLFIGNLDPALSDDAFKQAFSGVRYPSFVKSKIVRDKYTNKGKGYGFVSYSDPEDFLKVWKEMNDKYVGTRPVKISKATAGVKAVNIGSRKAGQLDAKQKQKSGTVAFERSNAAMHMAGGDGSGGYGPERTRKSYIRR
ncbi:hypothetical protein OIO90_005337 [Microbotryomycetes sp. JL221]|nr:hypothetical protein OIO90_005337 [Microbotryomycetes sp. JL221]